MKECKVTSAIMLRKIHPCLSASKRELNRRLLQSGTEQSSFRYVSRVNDLENMLQPTH